MLNNLFCPPPHHFYFPRTLTIKKDLTFLSIRRNKCYSLRFYPYGIKSQGVCPHPETRKKEKVTAGLERLTLRSMTDELIILLDKYMG